LNECLPIGSYLSDIFISYFAFFSYMTKPDLSPSALERFVHWHYVRPGANVRRLDPESTRAFDGSKEEGKEALAALNERIGELHDVLYAEHKHKLLMVFQAMDTGGKDGTIKKALYGFNPLGMSVVSFKKPTDEELDHDYLWRVHQHVPGKGEVAIFNRSHYEDVLVVRVNDLVPAATWQKRYQHINDFERMLTDEGTTVLKFFLNITKAEQAERLQERLDDPTKQWKFNPGDVAERKKWDRYMAAYTEAISKTSTTNAPWFAIPANKNWYRNLAVAAITVHTLENLGMKYPAPMDGIDKVRIR